MPVRWIVCRMARRIRNRDARASRRIFMNIAVLCGGSSGIPAENRTAELSSSLSQVDPLATARTPHRHADDATRDAASPSRGAGRQVPKITARQSPRASRSPSSCDDPPTLVESSRRAPAYSGATSRGAPRLVESNLPHQIWSFVPLAVFPFVTWRHLLPKTTVPIWPESRGARGGRLSARRNKEAAGGIAADPVRPGVRATMTSRAALPPAGAPLAACLALTPAIGAHRRRRCRPRSSSSSTRRASELARRLASRRHPDCSAHRLFSKRRAARSSSRMQK